MIRTFNALWFALGLPELFVPPLALVKANANLMAAIRASRRGLK